MIGRHRRLAGPPAVPATGGRGEPRIDGHVEIGTDVEIAGAPAASHLATGGRGVIRVGDGVRIGTGAAISSQLLVEIGDHAVLGAHVTVMDSDFHVAGARDVAPEPLPVSIGRRARIGHRAVILPGASIGDDAVVGPGSVVSGTVAAGAHVAGNPARPQLPGGAHDGASTVSDVVAAVFDLGEPPAAARGPDDIPGWDSLGALRLLIELESAFGVVLDDGHLASVRTVGDLDRLVDVAVAERAERE